MNLSLRKCSNEIKAKTRKSSKSFKIIDYVSSDSVYLIPYERHIATVRIELISSYSSKDKFEMCKK